LDAWIIRRMVALSAGTGLTLLKKLPYGALFSRVF
jgi:hypothetical protein